MTKKKMLFFILALISIIIVILTILSQSTSNTDSQYKTDIQPVMDRFPLLEKINKAYWKAEVIGDNSFGPSSYWMKGYVFLDTSIMERIQKLFNWNYMDNFNPAMKLDIHHEQEHRWAYSEEFNSYIKASDFIGNFYLDVNNGLIYFEVEK
ncbi:hypothetical protein EBB07_14595 [Paenibacillaceae bacterium]|nr:hypothetical protein EBB07_14595 [Paenibacillaceae bacterium]